ALALGVKPALNVETELGGDDHPVAQRRQRLADEFFVGEWAVDFGGIEEGDAALHGRAQHGNHLLLVSGGAVREAHSHAAQAEGGDFQVAVSQFSLLHGDLLRRWMRYGDSVPQLRDWRWPADAGI